MNLILKDIDLIRFVSNVGTKNSLFPENSKLWISQLSELDLDFMTNQKMKYLDQKNEVRIYNFTEHELEMAYNIYKQYADNMSFSNASIIIAAQKLKNASVVVSDKMFCKICRKEKIKIYENIKK